MKSSLAILVRYILQSCILVIFTAGTITGQMADSLKSRKDPAGVVEKHFLFRSWTITSFTFGGNGVNLTSVNGHFTVMTGGKGSVILNNRFTIGGGGWGMGKGIEVPSENEGEYDFIKLGYGGIDVGVLLVPGKKFILGSKLLAGAGAIMLETVPESRHTDFSMFPVLEPSLYCQVALNDFFRLETGASYRYIFGTDLPYTSNQKMSGIAVYIGFLVSTGNRR
jgi:hypothetical protein